MKNLFIIIALLSLSLFSVNVNALDRTKVAEKASDVAPLLIGETIPDITLFSSEGAPLNLRQKVAEKPTILLFYRGGWCPFCNAQLSQIQMAEEEIRKLGYQLIAISPDTPDALKKSISERELDYQLVSDFALQATRQFGLAFYIPKNYSDKISKHGGKTQSLDGDERSILPVPAVFILDQKGVIQFEYVNPNFKVRVKPQLLIDAARYALEGNEAVM